MAISETPDLQLPYPEPGSGEPNNVPAHMKALAEQLEAVLPATFVPKVAYAPRTPINVATITTPTGATTPGSGDMTALALTHGVFGDHTAVPNTPSAGYFFGFNNYAYTGDQVTDCTGLDIMYGALIESVVRLPAGGQAIGSVFGCATHVAFSGAAAGSTVNRMASLFVQAATRKDGAIAGTADQVYGLLIEAQGSVGASTHARSLYVEGGETQIVSLLMSGSTINTVGGQALVLTSNAFGPGLAPSIRLNPGDAATDPSDILVTAGDVNVNASKHVLYEDGHAVHLGYVKVRNTATPWFDVDDLVGADAHAEGNAGDHVLGGLRGYTHYGTTVAGSVEVRSVFNTHGFNGGDIVLSPRSSVGTKTDQLRAYGQGGVGVNIPTVGMRTLQVGAADSAGAGYRTVRVAN